MQNLCSYYTRPSSGSRDVYKIVNIFHDFGDASHSNKYHKMQIIILYHDFITTDNNF